MNIRASARQLCILCRSAVCGEPFTEDGVDLAALYSLAYRHDLDGSLYYTISDALGDGDALSAFEEAHARLRHRTVTDAQQIHRLLRLLDQEKIPVMRVLSTHLRACFGERFFLADTRERLLVDPADAERLDALLLAHGFACAEGGERSRLYLRRPYFFLEIIFAPRDKAQEANIGFGGAWERAELLDGFESVYKTTETDAYLFLLSDLYEHLGERGVSLCDVLKVALVQRHLAENVEQSALRAALAPRHLDSFESVLLTLYRAWIEGEELSPSMRVLSDLLLARGSYSGLEDYLRESTREKNALAYAFLPYSKMRVAHPFCRSPFLYPLAAALRLIHLARRRAGQEYPSAPIGALGLRAEEHRALWRAVGVSLP